ncbi:hypothetical protein B0H16DRAFT_934533 [Mycena metata]|uniref:Uncharacterized protein n=1 Tax=Mycena metata TaxID=1033252 RepID=A0AAD7IR21_9AGAR|nr:hypothetical protein B0H16DRAFT_934533 [Mycena metata]
MRSASKRSTREKWQLAPRKHRNAAGNKDLEVHHWTRVDEENCPIQRQNFVNDSGLPLCSSHEHTKDWKPAQSSDIRTSGRMPSDTCSLYHRDHGDARSASGAAAQMSHERTRCVASGIGSGEPRKRPDIVSGSTSKATPRVHDRILRLRLPVDLQRPYLRSSCPSIRGHRNPLVMASGHRAFATGSYACVLIPRRLTTIIPEYSRARDRLVDSVPVRSFRRTQRARAAVPSAQGHARAPGVVGIEMAPCFSHPVPVIFPGSSRHLQLSTPVKRRYQQASSPYQKLCYIPSLPRVRCVFGAILCPQS